MLLYDYQIQLDQDDSNPISKVYFPDLDRSHYYNRNDYNSNYDIGPEVVRNALRSLVVTMVGLGQIVDVPDSSGSLRWNVRLCPLDWDMELRVRLSNWFLTNGYKSFADISTDYKFRTGIPLPVKALIELFISTDDEIDLEFVFRLINTFKIPFKLKALAIELG